MASWVDFPAVLREIVVDGNGKITSYFRYAGNSTDGFLCKLWVNGVFIGEYNSKANARTAGNSAGA